MSTEEIMNESDERSDAPLFFQPGDDFINFSQSIKKIEDEISKVIVGQKEMIELLIAGLLTGGHVLLEGVPGVAKTLTAKLLARCIDVPFHRIQFTPDLMPSDVTGTLVFNPKTVEFEFKKGPIFSNIILIDEINRAPAKTQASLFEVMEEKQVTIDGTTHVLDSPFMVVATQNPIEHEGTYRLPEAQLDRFLFKIVVPYPTAQEEVDILQKHNKHILNELSLVVATILRSHDILEMQLKTRNVHIEEKLLTYIAQIISETRHHKSLYLGASPRASIGIMNASKAIAAIRGRNFVTPDDIKYVAPPVLRHRIVLTPEKELEGTRLDDVVHSITNAVEVPR